VKHQQHRQRKQEAADDAGSKKRSRQDDVQEQNGAVGVEEPQHVGASEAAEQQPATKRQKPDAADASAAAAPLGVEGNGAAGAMDEPVDLIGSEVEGDDGGDVIVLD